MRETMPHHELAEVVLEESGYTDMWQKDKSADAHGRLENLKEFVRSMEEFPDLLSFLEHVSLVMERNEADNEDRVSLMTLHAAKGLEFDTVFLPGWEEGLFPNQRALDESGLSGLEEERRLAHVGLTPRAPPGQDLLRLEPPHPRHVERHGAEPLRRRAAGRIRRGDRGAGAVSVADFGGGFGGRPGGSRFDQIESFGSSYETPGWQRAQSRKAAGGFSDAGGGGWRGEVAGDPARR